MSRRWETPPRIIGHRGAPADAPENTRASFDAAVRAGVEAVELDARLSADGDVVVHHDAALGRILPGSASIEASSTEDLTRAGIPLLADILTLPLLVDVELKADAQNASGLPTAVAEVVRRADALDRVLVTSFDPDLSDAYARIVGRDAGVIVPFPPDEDELASYPRLRHIALIADAAFPEVLAACQAAKRPTLVWTVNDAPSARAFLAAGADSIITDRPAQLAREL